MTLIILLLALGGEDPTYAEISKKHSLGQADGLMREGKYLEAAVAYRNILLQPGDREAVRIPLALALLAKGDTAYAGIELRRAQMLYPDFSRLRIDPAALFGSKEALARMADQAARQSTEGDEAEVHAGIAYVWALEGERDRALAALARYTQSRGEDPFARDLRAMIQKGAKGAQATPPPTPVGAGAASPAAIRGGEPVRAGIRLLEPVVQPRGEIFFR